MTVVSLAEGDGAVTSSHRATSDTVQPFTPMPPRTSGFNASNHRRSHSAPSTTPPRTSTSAADDVA